MPDDSTSRDDGVFPQEYWESRLSRSFDWRGVGNIGLPPSYNRWLHYVKARVFRRVVKRYLRSPSDAAILDIGSGIGVVIEQWKELGARRIVGSDLTEKAVTELRGKYSDLEFLRIDIGSSDPQDLERQAGAFDVVSMLDVAFHLMTEEAYHAALRHVASVLKPGGLFILSENFAGEGELKTRHHTVARPWTMVHHWLETAGFDIMGRHPQYVFMERPTRFRTSPLRQSWRVVWKLARVGDRSGWLVGAILTPLECLATRIVRRGPSIELLVCRRRS